MSPATSVTGAVDRGLAGAETGSRASSLLQCFAFFAALGALCALARTRIAEPIGHVPRNTKSNSPLALLIRPVEPLHFLHPLALFVGEHLAHPVLHPDPLLDHAAPRLHHA